MPPEYALYLIGAFCLVVSSFIARSAFMWRKTKGEGVKGRPWVISITCFAVAFPVLFMGLSVLLGPYVEYSHARNVLEKSLSGDPSAVALKNCDREAYDELVSFILQNIKNDRPFEETRAKMDRFRMTVLLKLLPHASDDALIRFSGIGSDVLRLYAKYTPALPVAAVVNYTDAAWTGDPLYEDVAARYMALVPEIIESGGCRPMENYDAEKAVSLAISAVLSCMEREGPWMREAVTKAQAEGGMDVKTFSGIVDAVLKDVRALPREEHALVLRHLYTNMLDATGAKPEAFLMALFRKSA